MEHIGGLYEQETYYVGCIRNNELNNSNYKQPVGECISKSSLKTILKYLDEKYSFSSKIFPSGQAFFIRMPYSHKIYNSECATPINEENRDPHFFLYHMKEKGPGEINPEAVLFHELGHAIHARYFGDVSKVPDDIIDNLQKLCFPRLKQDEAAKQSELFADVLSVGLMYQTPYEKYDVYKEVHPDDKMAFKALVENLLKNIIPNNPGT
ncbi:hypothetical protein LQZ19_06635 [Treponema primitia]|uniref:hypothetical protein n=1 Tax=Treponema primitia TaxID=88058 RepID=UPI00397F4879